MPWDHSKPGSPWIPPDPVDEWISENKDEWRQMKDDIVSSGWPDGGYPAVEQIAKAKIRKMIESRLLRRGPKRAKAAKRSPPIPGKKGGPDTLSRHRKNSAPLIAMIGGLFVALKKFQGAREKK